MNRIGSRNGINYFKVSGSTNSFVNATMEIGPWNMAITGNTGINIILVNHNLSSTEWKTVRNLNAVIRSDNDDTYYDLLFPNYSGFTHNNIGDDFKSTSSGNIFINPTEFGLRNLSGGVFSVLEVFYTSTTVNRGYISFMYQPDEYL